MLQSDPMEWDVVRLWKLRSIVVIHYSGGRARKHLQVQRSSDLHPDSLLASFGSKRFIGITVGVPEASRGRRPLFLGWRGRKSAEIACDLGFTQLRGPTEHPQSRLRLGGRFSSEWSRYVVWYSFPIFRPKERWPAGIFERVIQRRDSFFDFFRAHLPSTIGPDRALDVDGLLVEVEASTHITAGNRLACCRPFALDFVVGGFALQL